MSKMEIECKAFPKPFKDRTLSFQSTHTSTHLTQPGTVSPHGPWFPGSMKSHRNLGTKQPLDDTGESGVLYKSHPGTKGLIFHWRQWNVSGHTVTLFPWTDLHGQKSKGSLWLSLRIPETFISSEVRWEWWYAILSGEYKVKPRVPPCFLDGVGEWMDPLSILAFLIGWLQREATGKLGVPSFPLNQGLLFHSTRLNPHFVYFKSVALTWSCT